MEFVVASSSPGKAGVLFLAAERHAGAPRRKKPRSPSGKPQLRTSCKPTPVNALAALRDGATCSDGMW
jgi:hypothetical protein